MSRQLPDPQIVHLRAMRRGDIAVAIPSPATATVGVTKQAAPSPEGLQSVSISPAAPSQGTVDSSISITLSPDGSFPALDNTATTVLSQDNNEFINLTTSGSSPLIFFELVTLTATPEIDIGTGSAPGITVVHQTSVV